MDQIDILNQQFEAAQGTITKNKDRLGKLMNEIEESKKKLTQNEEELKGAVDKVGNVGRFVEDLNSKPRDKIRHIHKLLKGHDYGKIDENDENEI